MSEETVMEPNFTWHDLDQDGGVLELHEHLTDPAPALELHVQATADGSVVAFWATDDGQMLGWVEPGEA